MITCMVYKPNTAGRYNVGAWDERVKKHREKESMPNNLDPAEKQVALNELFILASDLAWSYCLRYCTTEHCIPCDKYARKLLELKKKLNINVHSFFVG